MTEFRRGILPVRWKSSLRHARFELSWRHSVDPSKFHETLAHAWVLAVKHFMVRARNTSSEGDFIDKSTVLTERLLSGDARTSYNGPNLDPIPSKRGERVHPHLTSHRNA